ncbi:hypothetical protein V6Z11_D12G257900 [Gossypium hirsutum]
MKLNVYADKMSQPSRAVVFFCKVNGIDYEEIKVHIPKGQHLTPEFEAINLMQKLPAIADGRFKLFERYLKSISCTPCFFPSFQRFPTYSVYIIFAAMPFISILLMRFLELQTIGRVVPEAIR